MWHNVRIRLTSEYNFWCTTFQFFIFGNYVAASLFKHCGDIESNPGPPLHHHYNVSQLTLYCVNIRSIRAVVSENPTIRKFDYLCAEASSRENIIVCVSETWLHKSDKDIDIERPDYTMYRVWKLRVTITKYSCALAIGLLINPQIFSLTMFKIISTRHRPHLTQ